MNRQLCGNLSSYVTTFSSEAQARYLDKIQLIRGLDPFMSVDASGLVSYLVLQTSFVTSNQFKAHKSLEAYNQFVSGWVQTWKLGDIFLTSGKVCL